MAHPEGLTTDGYELQFGTNFIGHALLVRLLLPTLQQTALQTRFGKVRIMCLTSGSHARAPLAGIIFDMLKTDGSSISIVERYGQSKLANILYDKELAKMDLITKIVNNSTSTERLASTMLRVYEVDQC